MVDDRFLGRNAREVPSLRRGIVTFGGRSDGPSDGPTPHRIRATTRAGIDGGQFDFSTAASTSARTSIVSLIGSCRS